MLCHFQTVLGPFCTVYSFWTHFSSPTSGENVLICQGRWHHLRLHNCAHQASKGFQQPVMMEIQDGRDRNNQLKIQKTQNQNKIFLKVKNISDSRILYLSGEQDTFSYDSWVGYLNKRGVSGLAMCRGRLVLRSGGLPLCSSALGL